MNGGLHQFFFNSAGDRAAQSVAAVRELGAATTAAIVEDACARFPDRSLLETASFGRGNSTS